MLPLDFRYALRLFRRNPTFTAVAVLSLALGIGANTAIYSLFYTIMLRTLPVAYPEQLVELVRNSPDEFHWAGYWGWDKYEFFCDRNHVFSGVTGMSFDNLASVRTAGVDPETLILENVPANYFRVLGLEPVVGRFFTPADAPSSGDGNVVVVSWSYWNRRFHRDPSVVGARIFYNNEPKIVIGVAPRAYAGPRVGSRTDLWMASQNNLTMIARLKPGVTIAQAQAEMDVLYPALLQQTGATTRDRKLELLPAGAGLVRIRDQYGKPLMLLLAIVGMLLLLACVNMASLLLARSAGRQHEIAVRVGLGASRWRLVRQMLTESVLLSAAGTLAGIAVAWFATGALVRILASSRAFEHIDVEVQPDLHLLLFTAGTTLITGLLFGLAPAWYAFRSAPASTLRHTGKGDSWSWRLFGKTLVAGQIAISVLLLSAAVIFLNHLAALRHFDLGFRSDHVMQLTVDPPPNTYPPALLAPRYRELLQRLEAVPGVHSASISGCTPLEGCGIGGRFLKAEGHIEDPQHRRRTALALVTPRYFETLGIPLIAGRDFAFRDAGRSRVAILSRGAARYYFPGVDPVGKHIAIDPDSQTDQWFEDDRPYEIIGVAGDVKSFEIRDAPYPTIYFDMFQENRLADHLELRTNIDPASLAPAVRRILHELLPAAPLVGVSTLEQQVDSNLVPERLLATLSQFFGVLATVLAGIGVYGLLAYTVTRRTSEIGVRMALGATPGDVTRLVLRDVSSMVFPGLLAGAALIFWTLPLATHLIPDLKPDSSLPLAFGAAVIAAVALLASGVPLHRAASVDPMDALRHQ